MKYTVQYSNAFKRQYKKIKQQPKKLNAFRQVLALLAAGEKLEEKHDDHKLKGKYKGFRECHILPDLLLIYEKDDGILLLHCIAIGTHTELF